jgi:hypothetical protein
MTDNSETIGTRITVIGGARLTVFEPMGDCHCCRVRDVRDLSTRQRGI